MRKFLKFKNGNFQQNNVILSRDIEKMIGFPLAEQKWELENIKAEGFPFEKFIGALLFYSGFEVKTGQILLGKCVSHEVDVVAKKNGQHIVAECKFHSEEGRNCDVKIPLYVHSRYHDILNFYSESNNSKKPNEGWVVTNTRFTEDA